MLAGTVATRVERLALLRDAALAKPTAQGWVVLAFQIWLVLLWHTVMVLVTPPLVAAVVVPASKFWYHLGLTSSYTGSVDSWWSSPGELLVGLASSLIAVVLEGVAGWIPFRFVTWRQQLPLELFVRSWWRTCLWGTAVIPVGAVVVSLLPPISVLAGLSQLTLPVYLVFGPAFFARSESRSRRRRLARWRPVCPECGYSLRKLQADRCPECGVAFPTKSRVFRRWAGQRLNWERVQRGNFLFAYLKTVLTIVFWPWGAARGVAIPDRLPRAIRWATVHLVLLALAGVALGSSLYFSHWIQRKVMGTPGWPGGVSGAYEPSTFRVALWAGQSFGAWLVALAALPLLGIGLGYVSPGRHPAASRAIAKWSLYISIVLAGLFVAIYTAQFLNWLWFPRFVGGFKTAWSPAHPSVTLLAIPYGIWWAIGVSVNPYLRARGFRVFLANAVLFVVAWLLLTDVLFPADAFGSLL